MLLTKNSDVPIDVKALSEDGSFEGYGSIFGNIDSYGEIVEPGAFSSSLAEAKRKGRSVKMLWQHDPMQPIGVWNDLTEDGKGLRVRGTLLKEASPRAAEAYGLLKAGALDGLSIGYRVIKAIAHPDKENILSLTKLDLKEVSVVTFAANDRALVDNVKHLLAAGIIPTVCEFEEFLRDAGGFSKCLAAAIASRAAQHLRRESEAEADPLAAFWAALVGADVIDLTEED